MKPLDATPCYDNPHPYDVLIDPPPGPNIAVRNAALREARAMCSACPVWVKCFADNRDEIWVKRILGERIVGEPVHRPICGDRCGYETHRRNGERACEDCLEAVAVRSSQRRRMAREAAA